ncbi:unnamed protein product [Prunus armeniaca]|uniref:Uncharacterized protein n=1 Tax=Prunus armeniaca TaxID=36596 RepID=A0A6J5XDE4_PRUAR|nr:hypothetical protein GBA52_016962 [Prunus armeniaca]CAB4280223.1 unnamed protein product [Prunus armeniaca]CAB4310637.1 unnamed protein product [Prunus armeniaca]
MAGRKGLCSRQSHCMLNKARNVEDLKLCLEMKSQLFKEHKLTSTSESEEKQLQRMIWSPGKSQIIHFPKSLALPKSIKKLSISSTHASLPLSIYKVDDL